MTSKTMPRLWLAGWLAVELVAGCGKSASHDGPNVEPSPVGGAENEPGATAGVSGAIAGRPTQPGGGSTSAGGTSASGTSGMPQQPGGGEGGAAGADPGPALELPAGCRARAPTETDLLCSLAVDCDTAPSTRSYCHRLESGLWECQCADHENLYRVEGAAGLEACALAARICSTDDLSLGEESCESVESNVGENRCDVELTCAALIELEEASPARAWRLRTSSARCLKSDFSDAMSCNCVQEGKTTPHALLAQDTATACAPLAEFCWAGEAPVFDGEDACASMVGDADSARCIESGACGPQHPLSDEVSLVSLLPRGSECTPGAGGSSECFCYSDDQFFLFRLATPFSAASCQAATPNCNPNAVIEAEGPPRCSPPTANAYFSACDGSLECEQDATVDGRSIVAHSKVAVACQRADEGKPWFCSCATGPLTARFELGVPGATDVQACNQATDACVERLGLHIGPADEYLSAPSPIQ